jgi:hypothetical protein
VVQLQFKKKAEITPFIECLSKHYGFSSCPRRSLSATTVPLTAAFFNR